MNSEHQRSMEGQRFLGQVKLIMGDQKTPPTTIKKSVAVVLINKEGEILSVSRKDDHTNFGLVGGKVDPEDNDDTEAAAIRETKEETGLDIFNLRLILVCPEGTRMAYTYLADWTGEIHTDEPHVVKWGSFEPLLQGTYANYNKHVFRSLLWMGVDFKN